MPASGWCPLWLGKFRRECPTCWPACDGCICHLLSGAGRGTWEFSRDLSGTTLSWGSASLPRHPHSSALSLPEATPTCRCRPRHCREGSLGGEDRTGYFQDCTPCLALNNSHSHVPHTGYTFGQSRGLGHQTHIVPSQRDTAGSLSCSWRTAE